MGYVLQTLIYCCTFDYNGEITTATESSRVCYVISDVRLSNIQAPRWSFTAHVQGLIGVVGGVGDIPSGRCIRFTMVCRNLNARWALNIGRCNIC